MLGALGTLGTNSFVWDDDDDGALTRGSGIGGGGGVHCGAGGGGGIIVATAAYVPFAGVTTLEVATAAYGTPTLGALALLKCLSSLPGTGMLMVGAKTVTVGGEGMLTLTFMTGPLATESVDEAKTIGGTSPAGIASLEPVPPMSTLSSVANVRRSMLAW
jgi:hypothetical protein